MGDFINLRLLANPLNYFIVTLMLVIFLIFVDVVFRQFGKNNIATSQAEI